MDTVKYCAKCNSPNYPNCGCWPVKPVAAPARSSGDSLVSSTGWTATRRMVEVIDNRATGAAMRTLRKQAKVSLRAVARRWGVSAAYMSDLELGRRGWTDEKVAAFVDAVKKPSIVLISETPEIPK